MPNVAAREGAHAVANHSGMANAGCARTVLARGSVKPWQAPGYRADVERFYRCVSRQCTSMRCIRCIRTPLV